MPNADSRLYVALDLPSVEDAREMVRRLGDSVLSYKVGLQLLPIGGAELCRELKTMGKAVFADFKLHDIGATVEKATRSVASLGVDHLTVHACPQVMVAAAAGAAGSTMRILGVTVLTSLDQEDLRAIGHEQTADALVMLRAGQAVAAGIQGVVSSPLEAAMLRARVPGDFDIVTPGVRPVGVAHGDQSRVSTPADAIRNGASHIVVGRPITQSSDPRAAALAIAEELEGL